MDNVEYIIIPGTDTKVYENSLVELLRLPDTKWLLQCGTYTYNGVKRKGWYFASKPPGTIIPVFVEDLVNMKVIDGPKVKCFPSPVPPVPVPTIFTVEDKKMLDASMVTVPTLADRDALVNPGLDNGKVVRVNDVEGYVEYYEWDKSNQTWIPATLGYRYMTRDQIHEEFAGTVVDVLYSDSTGLLTLVKYNGDEEERQLTGLAHDISYSDFKIRVPIFGKPDLVIDLAQGTGIGSMRIEEHYEISPGVFVPALVVTEVIEGQTVDIATDVTSLYNQFENMSSTDTVSLYVDSSTSTLKADVKISSFASNVLNVDNTGLYVDISGKVDKYPVIANYLLVSDGLGGFTMAGNGIIVKDQGTMDGQSNTEVPTSNLIAAAIQAAITAATASIQSQIDALSARVSSLEDNFIPVGGSNEIITSTTSGIQRSGYTIGGSSLVGSSGLIASEEAVVQAISWNPM